MCHQLHRSKHNTKPELTFEYSIEQQRTPYAFPTILKMVVGAVKRNLLSIDIDDTDEEGDTEADSRRIPTMDEILKKAKHHHGIDLDEKHTRAYEMLCTTFM